ncbi:hypothetical protein C8J56DRAFT_769249, partial [Mycena floridula]
VEPEHRDTYNPNTVEVDEVAKGAFFEIGLEEDTIPVDAVDETAGLRNRQKKSRRRFWETHLVIQHNPRNSRRILKQLIHIVVPNNRIMVPLSSYKLSVNNLVSLVPQKQVQRPLWHRVGAILTFRRPIFWHSGDR